MKVFRKIFALCPRIRAYHFARAKTRDLFAPCSLLCLVENSHICQACILKHNLILNPTDSHISALIKPLVVRSVFAQVAHHVKPGLALVTLVLIGDCVELFGGHHHCGLGDQLYLFVGADSHSELLVTAILGGLEPFAGPAGSDVVAFVDVNVALVLKENQDSVCAGQSIVVTEEVGFCHDRYLLSFCTLIVS